MTASPVFALSAGEVSGDKLAGELARELRRLYPQCQLFGVGGECMRDAGVEIIADYRFLAVMGYWDVLKALPGILAVRRQFLQRLKQTPPTMFIGVDAPDFNLPMARRAKLYGAKTVQYVAPSVWMWRARRLAAIRRAVGAVWCLLPFEKPVFTAAGINATFVGHPATTRPLPSRIAVRQCLAVAEDEQVILLLPGTRQGDLSRHLPLFAETVAKIAAPKRRFVTVGATADMLGEYLPMATILPFDEALAAADVAMVKSGTASLEAALAGVPMVIVYRLSGIAHWLVGWRRFSLPYFGLPNIICRRFVVPELLLGEANPAAVAMTMERLLTSEPLRQKMRTAFATIHKTLATPEKTAAQAAAAMLEIQPGSDKP